MKRWQVKWACRTRAGTEREISIVLEDSKLKEVLLDYINKIEKFRLIEVIEL